MCHSFVVLEITNCVYKNTFMIFLLFVTWHMVVRVKKADDTQDAVHVVDSMLLPVGGVGQSHEVCPDILRFYSVFLKFHIDLELQLHTHSRVSVPFTHAVFLRAVGQRWLTHSLTYWKETFRHTGRNLPQNVPQLRSKSSEMIAA